MKEADALVWGNWLLVLLTGTGMYLMLRLHFLPIRKLGYALRSIRKAEEGGRQGISPLAALTTELAATIGTGNIVGVASALTLGGPGALVWMILAAVAGLATKLVESTLSVHFRVVDQNGMYKGGPMYVLERGLAIESHRKVGMGIVGKKRRNCGKIRLDIRKSVGKMLAGIYAFLAVFASFGMGNMAQSNSIACSLKDSCQIPTHVSGVVLGILALLVIIGGIQGISKLTLYLVPGMALFYLGGISVILFCNRASILPAICEMLRLAFVPKAMLGGTFGCALSGTLGCHGNNLRIGAPSYSVQTAARYGISRGVFSNEAGLGASGISAATANTSNPVYQGYISMTGVFFDTIVICSMTGLAILVSGVMDLRTTEGTMLTGSALVVAAFDKAFGKGGGFFVSLAISLFAFATIIAWAYQGECAFLYLLRKQKWLPFYRICYSLMTMVGCICSLEIVWDFSDIMNGLMVIPNLIGVLVLSPMACRMIKEESATTYTLRACFLLTLY